MAPISKKKMAEKGPPGRPVHGFWSMGFRRVLKQCEKTHRTMHGAYCVICNKVLCNTASKRLTAHRRICNLEQTSETTVETVGKPDASSNLKEEVTKMLSPENGETITFIDIDASQQFMQEQSTSEQISKTEYTFVDNTEEHYEEFKFQTTSVGPENSIEIAMAKFFIGCNIPFSAADSKYYKKFCLSLNPHFKHVTSEQLSGPLLDSIYSKFHKDLKPSPSSVLLLDCWKNESTNVKNITVMLKTESNDTVFLDNFELASGKDVGNQELTEIAKASILEAYEQFKTEVYAIIMGFNTNKMDNTDNVWHLPCNVYVVKSLIKECITLEFLNSICKVLKHLNTILKHDELENNISSDMRWSNVKWILEYCITNLATIQTVISTDDTIKLAKEYRCLFFDEEVIHKTEVYFAFLETIHELSIVCQTPNSTIADVTEHWLSIESPSSDQFITEKFIEKRNSVLIPQCLVANFLHPVYRGKKLTHDQLNKVDEFLLNELDVDGLNSLHTYQNEDAIFRVLNQKDGLSAPTYWSLTRRTHSNLSNLALRLLAIPASITCNFSQIFHNIKNKSLKPEQVRKICAVYYYLKEKVDIE